MSLTTRYSQIAEHVRGQIAHGGLRLGARVASVRTLSRQFEASTNTVLHALALLEAEGLVEARPQSGFFVRAPPGPPLDRPTAAKSMLTPVPLSQRDPLQQFFTAMSMPAIAPFGSACPSASLLPADKLATLLSRVAKVEGAKALAYDPLPGVPLLRREISKIMSHYGCSVAPDEVLTTVGAVEAIHLALKAATQPGDVVMVQAPCYFGFLNLLTSLHLRVVEVSSTEDGIDLHQVKDTIKRAQVKACLFTANFSNPQGLSIPLEQKRALVALCAREKVALVESDVYGDLQFVGERPLPLKAFDTSGNVLYCSSFSKTLAPSFRVGWIAPGRFLEKVLREKFTHTVATPRVTQAAIAEFLTTGSYERHLRPLRQHLHQQVSDTRDAIGRCFPKKTRISHPAGGFLLWVELPNTAPLASEVQKQALSAGISIAPGPLFSAHPRFARCFRLSCGYPLGEGLTEALQVLGRLCGRP